MINSHCLPILMQCALFHHLSPQDCEIIIGSGRIKSIPQDTYLFHQGEPAHMMYVILSGRVKLSQVTSQGDQVIVNYFGPTSGLGIIVALSDMEYPLSAEAVQACEVVAWHTDEMKQLMAQFPQLALNGLSMIGHRFANLQKRFQEMATERVERRVARALIRLVRQFGKREDAGILIDMPLSREDLAQMTGTNLYNVSRILSKWEHQGFIQTSRKQIILCKAHKLVTIAEDLPASSE